MSAIKDKSKEYRLRIKEERKAKGICTRCGQHPAIEGKLNCEKCKQYRDNRSELTRPYQKEYRKKRKVEALNSGICTWCYKEPVKEGRTTCDKCNERGLEGQRRRRLQRKIEGTCHFCSKPASPGYVLCEYHRKKQNGKHQIKRRKVFEHYGLSCACCGESTYEFLSIDHMNNDGAEHRRKLNIAKNGLYQWLINNNFPEGFQTLCYNCNFAKGHYGKCPHEDRR
jgi:hypothetical protein